MADEVSKDHSRMMLVFAGVTAAGTLLAGLAAAGVLSRSDQVDEGDPPTSMAVESVGDDSTEAPAEPDPETSSNAPLDAEVTLVYLGDSFGCGLGITIDIADRSASPTSNEHTMSGVSIGRQDYDITGTISCPGAGSCQATGSGQIDISDGTRLFVEWVSTSVGQCEVTLRV